MGRFTNILFALVAVLCSLPAFQAEECTCTADATTARRLFANHERALLEACPVCGEEGAAAEGEATTAAEGETTTADAEATPAAEAEARRRLSASHTAEELCPAAAAGKRRRSLMASHEDGEHHDCCCPDGTKAEHDHAPEAEAEAEATPANATTTTPPGAAAEADAPASLTDTLSDAADSVTSIDGAYSVAAGSLALAAAVAGGAMFALEL